MVAIAIVSADPVLRRDLAQVLREESTITALNAIDDPAAALSLIEQNQSNDAIILADEPTREDLTNWKRKRGEIHVIVLVDDHSEAPATRDALEAGARAVLSRSAGREEILATIRAVTSGLVVLPRELLPTLLDGAPLGDDPMDATDRDHAQLTPRELDVLTAMANGASNKAIARQLGISVHTVKFHVASVFTKLNAESRTEAVTRAAQLGLVML
jgi:DNA-binding NarL/FixJ family response regulator